MTRQIHAQLLTVAEGLSSALHAALVRTGPVRLPNRKRASLAWTLCRTVAGQQLSVKAASTIWRRVAELCGEENSIDALLQTDHETLRSRGLSAAKAKSVHAIARAAQAGDLDDHLFARLDPSERASRLVALQGVGPWTADMINMFHFRAPDIWPAGDLATRKTLIALTDKRRCPIRTANRFAPYRTYLAMHMWRHADAPPLD